MTKLKFIYILVIIPFVTSAQNGIITTIGGNGSHLSTGDGGLAINASITGNGAGIFDFHQVYYFTEGLGNRIRKITPDGIIHAAAGNGTLGFGGDNGPATDAQMRNPKQTAFDSKGNLYIADIGNHRVRKVNAITGVISTFAGNGNVGFGGDDSLATSAELSAPTSLCVDPFDNVYIGDQTYGIIRKVDTFGIITTYAGIANVVGYTGDGGDALNAQLNNLLCLCSDMSGNIYLECGGNIRKINVVNHIITTVAGNSIVGFSGDGGPANQASLNAPEAFTVNKIGEMFIADTKNNRIRKVSITGIISTIVGSGIQGFEGDGGMADTAKLYWPEGVAIDSCGNMYINDLGNYRIRKVTFHPDCFPESVKHVNKENEISIYPNPAKEQLNIECSSGIKELRAMNTIGQVLIAQKNYAEKAIVNVSGLNSGVYFIQMSDKDGRVVTRRFVKE